MNIKNLIMPVPVIKYTCNFKCGKKATSDERRVSAHEKQCWKNPNNQTCKTCSNEIYEMDSDGFRTWINRGCKISSLNYLFEDIHEELKGSNTMHIRPIVKCPFWNQPTGNVESFIETVKEEVKVSKNNQYEPKRIHFPYFDVKVQFELNPIFP